MKLNVRLQTDIVLTPAYVLSQVRCLHWNHLNGTLSDILRNKKLPQGLLSIIITMTTTCKPLRYRNVPSVEPEHLVTPISRVSKSHTEKIQSRKTTFIWRTRLTTLTEDDPDESPTGRCRWEQLADDFTQSATVSLTVTSQLYLVWGDWTPPTCWQQAALFLEWMKTKNQTIYLKRIKETSLASLAQTLQTDSESTIELKVFVLQTERQLWQVDSVSFIITILQNHWNTAGIFSSVESVQHPKTPVSSYIPC